MWLPSSCGLQVAGAPLARQSSAASGTPALSAAEVLWRRRLTTQRRARPLHYNCLGLLTAVRVNFWMKPTRLARPARVRFGLDR
jgi:hypothetical protein